MSKKSTHLLTALLPLLGVIWSFAGCETNVGPNRQTVRTGGESAKVGVPTLDLPFPGGAQTSQGPGDYWFCFWNLENLFDDKNDNRNGLGDKEYDPWLAGNPQILQRKLGKLADAILSINDGKGPDILAAVEVESIRAMQLLQATLNARLDPPLHYTNLLMKEMSVGRHIAPAILTRLPVLADRTRSHGSRQRILEGQIVVGGKKLIVLASHWTSRLSDGAPQRAGYADAVYGAANAIYHNDPDADVLVCGDFNDNPTDVSVTQHLHADGDLSKLRKGPHLHLYNLMANKDVNQFGTLYYRGWDLFDQIVVSPGMLDNRGWSCDAASAIPLKYLAKPSDPQRKPWRFGGPNEAEPRGYSDHFPVIVRLRVQ